MMATTGGWLRNVNATVGNPMKMLLWCSRVFRESVSGFAIGSRAKRNLGAVGRKTGFHFC
jgi:hypothetical protein